MKLECHRCVNKDNFETQVSIQHYGLDGWILWMSFFKICIISSGESLGHWSETELKSIDWILCIYGMDKTWDIAWNDEPRDLSSLRFIATAWTWLLSNTHHLLRSPGMNIDVLDLLLNCKSKLTMYTKLMIHFWASATSAFLHGHGSYPIVFPLWNFPFPSWVCLLFLSFTYLFSISCRNFGDWSLTMLSFLIAF